MKPPQRFKAEEDLGPDEYLQVIQAERRGAARPRFESDEYRRYKNDGLRALGLDDEVTDDAGEKPLDAMSPADHFDDIRGR
ncbi:MAG: hypothetical protein QOI73_869 [Solirubrobacteraceae bacterium]|nr:hypothetical protein [Solirubrobacteraceae bacterium]